MDTKLGCLWNLELNLSSICQNIKNLRITVDLLLSRANGKQILLQVLCKLYLIFCNKILYLLET